jgi:hypothetical protein
MVTIHEYIYIYNRIPPLYVVTYYPRDTSFHGWSPYVFYIWNFHHCNNTSIYYNHFVLAFSTVLVSLFMVILFVISVIIASIVHGLYFSSCKFVNKLNIIEHRGNKVHCIECGSPRSSVALQAPCRFI